MVFQKQCGEYNPKARGKTAYLNIHGEVPND